MMYKHAELHARIVPYIMRRHKRATRMKITVHCSDSFTITLPRFAKESLAEQFIKEKADWILEKLEYFEQYKSSIFPHTNKARYDEHKLNALALVSQKLPLINKRYNFAYNSVAIRNQKTLWGSCSCNGRLSFNYKIVFLPDHLVEYLLTHELCHLKEMNHGSKFWNLVARTIPDYRARRRELKKKSLIFY